MTDIKFVFVIDDKFLSPVYTLKELLDTREEDIIDDMEVCNCSLNEANASCQGDCIKFENSRITNALRGSGLEYKNGGSEIFEGDIVNYPFKKITGKIVFENGGFCIVHNGVCKYDLDKAASLCIDKIGNIYETPELLNVKPSA